MPTASRQVITSIDDLDNPLWSTRGSARVLQPGAIRAEIIHLDLGDVFAETFDYSFPLASRGEVQPGRAGFAVPLRRNGETRINGEPLEPGFLHAYGPSTEVSNSSAGPVGCGVLTFPEHFLDRRAAEMAVDLDVPKRGQFRRIATGEWDRLRGLFGAVIGVARRYDGADLDAAVACALRDAFVDVSVRAFAAERSERRARSRAPRNSARVVRACEEHAARVHYRGVTLAELSAASGVGERQVREAFSRCFGMSPTAYLRIAALYDARRALLIDTDVRDPVTRAATEYGFWHLGRFAGQYRTLFGETPYETVTRVAGNRQRRRRVGVTS